MAWSAKRLSLVAGAAALLAEVGLNNSLVAGLLYATASTVAAPVIVHGVVVAHDAEVARLASDRQEHAKTESNVYHPGAAGSEPGDADQVARQSDANADDSPDMPRRLGPMLAARLAFLEGYESDPARARPVMGDLTKLLADDRLAFASFARRAERDAAWGDAHSADLAELHVMDARLDKLRAKALVD